MISSKRISLLSVSLVIIVIAAIIYAMLLPKSMAETVYEYGDGKTYEVTESDYYSTYSETGVAKIELKGSTATSKSKNVSIENSTITILGGGTYVLSGSLEAGNIIVDSMDSNEVRLVLNNASIKCGNTSPIYIKQAKKTIISLVPNTENTLEDAKTYVNQEDGKPNAVITSKDDLVINGSGKLNISANYEDGINASDGIKILEATLDISAEDDGITANDYLFIDANIDISKCYEGLEGGYITINGGEINIVSSDDGINAVGDGESSGFPMMGKSSEEKIADEDFWLTVNDGHIVINTGGDGFDSNGSAKMNGGFLEIYGPENGGNGSIDVGDGGYVLLMNGGKLLAAGNSGMAEEPSNSSAQRSIAFYLDENYSAGSTIKITDSNGTALIEGASSKKFNWLCFSSEAIKEGETYSLAVNGNAVCEITSEDISSVYGTKSGGFGGGPGMGGGEATSAPSAENGEMPTPPNMENGEMPTPPNMENGEMPTPPNMENGEMPSPPNMENGEMPTPPNMENGEMPTPPNMGSGDRQGPPNMNGGERPGRGNTASANGKRPSMPNTASANGEKSSMPNMDSNSKSSSGSKSGMPGKNSSSSSGETKSKPSFGEKQANENNTDGENSTENEKDGFQKPSGDGEQSSGRGQRPQGNNEKAGEENAETETVLYSNLSEAFEYYKTTIISLIVLAFAFIFVIFYKKRKI